MSDKLSERLQAIADHLRKAFPETSRQADHLDMLVVEVTALEAQLAAMREAEEGVRLRVLQLIVAGEEYADATQALEIEMRGRQGLVYGRMSAWPRYETARDKWNALVLERVAQEGHDE